MSGSPLPPSDQLLFAVWRAGGAAAAIELAGHALARNDHRRPQVQDQLRRLRAAAPLGETPEVPELSLELVSALVDRYRYHEARCVLRAAGLADAARGLAMVLDEALAPFPAEADPSFDAVLHLIRAGQAPSALRALEEVERQSVAPTEWLVRRTRALAALVRGGWRDGPVPVVEGATRATVLAKIRARDLPGALEAARVAEASELASVLKRLLFATEGVFTDTSHPDSSDPQTVPMEGHRLCEFQIRMGVLVQADRGYRAILQQHPDDERARALLHDVIALRQALGEQVEPMPPRTKASVGWLKKNAPRDAGGWAAGAPRYERFGDESVEDSTDVLEASQEAELLLKLGKADQALDMYRILAIRHPKQQTYRRRIAEIEALIAQRMTGAAAEVTMKHDLSDLRRRAVPTKPNVRLPDVEHPRYGNDDELDEFPTLIDVVPELDED